MKKLVSLGLVASLSFAGLVACSGNEAETSADKTTTSTETSKEETATTGEKVEIKLWLDDDAYAEAIEPAIDAAYPNIDIVYEKVGAVDART